MTFNKPFIGGYLFESHWSAGTQFLCADANLCTETELSSIREAGGRIDVDTSSVNFLLEACRTFFVFCDDTLTVSTAVDAYVFQCLVHCRYCFYSHLIGHIFRSETIGGGMLQQFTGRVGDEGLVGRVISIKLHMVDAQQCA